MKETPPRPQRLRRLSDEEIALWTEVARSVARRRGAALPTPSNPVRAARPPAPPPSTAEPPAARPAKPSAPPLAPIERRLKRELSRGRATIDAALDLHGLTQAEAHQALRGFLRHSQARGARLVIIVTGKGGAIDELSGWPNERGVLKRLTPQGLREPALRSVVLGFEDAGRAHGGSGALYVRLRRLQVPSGRP
ncbi:MAG TPA: Smr/MutS family protein [Roseiarcus sp.]